MIYTTEDRYGRIVAKIYKDNKDINRSMVRNGLAWVYDYYVEDQSLYIDQNLAKKNSFNIWSEVSPTPPWVFRRSN